MSRHRRQSCAMPGRSSIWMKWSVWTGLLENIIREVEQFR